MGFGEILGIGAIAVASVTYAQQTGMRGVTPVPDGAPRSAEKFDRLQSAALFVGVRTFDERGAIEVPYAADDAVDLAYTFTLDRRASLVPPRRVVIALSGRPQKEESRRRLEELRDAGVTVRGATSEDIQRLLEQQAAAAGRDGILIFSLATHGFIDEERVAHVLGSNSLFEHPRTALPLETLIDTAASTHAKRSLLLIDACRERFRTGRRSAGGDPQTVAPSLASRMGRAEGQVIFYAAPAGGYAYDDDARQNGVFTRAVLDGLSCEATAVGGLITVEKLREYVEREVLTWVRAKREPNRASAVQLSTSGRTDLMPLAVCTCPPCTRLGPDRVTKQGAVVTALDRRGQTLWKHEVRGEVARAVVADLDADGAREVIVHVSGEGEDGGQVIALDAQGRRVWTGGSLVERIEVGVLRKYKDEIVTVSSDHTLSVIGGDGAVTWSLRFGEPLRDLRIDRASTRHDWRIIAATSHRVSLVNPNRNGRVMWSRAVPEPIERISTIDRDRDQRLDIAVTTIAGATYYFDFRGRPIE